MPTTVVQYQHPYENVRIHYDRQSPRMWIEADGDDDWPVEGEYIVIDGRVWEVGIKDLSDPPLVHLTNLDPDGLPHCYWRVSEDDRQV